MTPEEFDSYIQEIKGRLPLPSEVRGDLIIPHGIYGYNGATGTPLYGQIVFTKEYHEGIAIGWKLKDN